MLIFITPTLLDPRSGGISETPISEVPLRGANKGPQAPRIRPDGSLAGGVSSVDRAIPWIQKEHALIRQVVSEKRASKKHSEQLQTLKNTVRALQQQIKRHVQKNPKQAKELHHNQWALIDLEEGITKTQKELHKKHFQLFSRPLSKAF